MWTLELIEEAKREIRALPADVRASFGRIADLLLQKGPYAVFMPYVRPVASGLWEMRLKARTVSPGPFILRLLDSAS